MLPAVEEIRDWSDAVDDARAAADRLEARLLRLERRSDRERADVERTGGGDADGERTNGVDGGRANGAIDGRDGT